MMPRLSKKGDFFALTDKKQLRFAPHISKQGFFALTHTEKAVKTDCFGHVELYMTSVSRSTC